MQARFRFHRLVALLGVLSLWLLSSCSGPELSVEAGLLRPPSAGEVTPDPRQGRAVVALWLSASNPRIAKDTAQQFAATAMFADGFTEDVSQLVRWSVQPVGKSAEVSVIDQKGLAQGKGEGQAVVTASLDGHLASTVMTVTLATISSLSVTPHNPVVGKGSSKQFTATATFSDGTTQDVTNLASWSVDDLAPGVDVALINGAGLATGNSIGLASVTAGYLSKSDTTTLTVNAAALVSIAVSPASPTIVKGTRTQFQAVGTFSDGTVQDITTFSAWSVTDVAPATGVAFINSRGLALGSKVGKAQISASLMGKTGSATATVVELALSSLAISPGGPSVIEGSTVALKAVGTYTDGSTQDLTSMVGWTATDIAPAMGVASINGSGQAVGMAAGQATIKASYLTSTATTTLTVRADDSFCSSDKWCWRNPAPQEQGLAATWGPDASTLWAVGEGGTILKWDGRIWSQQTSPVKTNLRGIWGTDATHIWAVGQSGTVLSYDGTSWRTQTVGTTKELTSIWGTDLTHVWAVGLDGIVLFWNGTTWAIQSTPVAVSLTGVWGSDSRNVWAVSSFSGYLLFWNGSTWATRSFPSTVGVRSIWGTDASHIWAVGDGGNIYFYNGMSWVLQATFGSTVNLTTVRGTDINHMWAVGENGYILRWSGSIWGIMRNDSPYSLRGLWVSDNTHLQAVGDLSTLLKGDGRKWAAQSAVVTRNELSGVWGLDASHVWAVGNLGVVAQWDGRSWSAQTLPVPFARGLSGLKAIWGSDASHIWGVGIAGAIFMWDGKAWINQSISSDPPDFNAVWGSDATHVWAVGTRGAVASWDGIRWRLQGSGVTSALYSIWGSDASHVWAVGSSGALVMWDGASWGPESTGGVTTRLLGISGYDATHMWIVGDGGLILAGDGATWRAQTSGTTESLSSVWASDSTHIWASGTGGTLLINNGTSWRSQVSGASNTLNGVWGSSPTHLWAVGVNGSILEKSR